MTGESDASAVAARIDELLAEFERVGDAAAGKRAEELVRTIVGFYGEGIGRIVGLLQDKDGGPGGELHRMLAADQLVSGILVLHELHPSSLHERVGRALEQVRPYLGSHSGDVELTGIDEDDVVHLRLRGNCDGCPSSTVTVKLAIENAIREAAPEVADIEVIGVADPKIDAGTGPGGRPLLPLATDVPEAPSGAWVVVDGAADLDPGHVTAIRIQREAVVLCNVDGELYVYRDRCPGCSSALAHGWLDGGLLHCPACPESYDVSLAGRGRHRSSLHLSPLPLLTADGSVRVAVPAEVAS